MDVAVAPLPSADGAPLTDPDRTPPPGSATGTCSAFTEVRPGQLRRQPPGRRLGGRHPAGPDHPARRPGRYGPDGGRHRHVRRSRAPAAARGPERSPTGSARVHVLSAAGGAAGPVTFLDGGPAFATALPFGASGGAVDVPAGPSTIVVDGTRLPVDLGCGVGQHRPRPGLRRRRPDRAGRAGRRRPGRPPRRRRRGGRRRRAAGGASLDARCPARPGHGVAAEPGPRLVVRRCWPRPPTTAVAAAPRPPGPPPVTLAAVDAPPAVAAPARLQVPSAGVRHRARADRRRTTSGALVPPADNTLAGLVPAGPAPGDAGPAVLAGTSTVRPGRRCSSALRDVAVGDAVTVTRVDGTTVRFTVTRVARYPKDAFPTAEVYGPTPDAQLRLITCGGRVRPDRPAATSTTSWSTPAEADGTASCRGPPRACERWGQEVLR